jgi:hypothetical protein
LTLDARLTAMIPTRQQVIDRNVMDMGACNEGIRELCGNAGVRAGS